MRTFLIIIGTLVSLVLLVVCTGVVLAIYGSGLDSESKAFVSESIQSLAGSCGLKQIAERATPELRGKIRPEDARSLCEGMSRLGKLVHADEAKGQSSMSFFTGSGSRISAMYVERVRFENGAGLFRVAALKLDGHWMLHGFHFDLDPSSVIGPGATRPPQQL